MRPETRKDVMISDLLHNLHPGAYGGNRQEKVVYAKGILVATVGMIQADSNFNFEIALAKAASLAPRVVIAGCCPDSWMEGFGMQETARNNEVVRTGPCR